ncbi:MAG: hypothetical protein LBN97_00315 [Oscillospiraceae bacterium]|jgi:hypothetical protein|nr:hypothetical protein [Oscillospiraceae bacterium]
MNKVQFAAKLIGRTIKLPDWYQPNNCEDSEFLVTIETPRQYDDDDFPEYAKAGNFSIDKITPFIDVDFKFDREEANER